MYKWLCHDLLHVTYFWHSTKKLRVVIVTIYVKNEQFDVHLTLVVRCGTFNNNEGESVIKY